MKNIETNFINFIIDNYSPTSSGTASKNNDGNSSGNEDEEVVENLNFHKIQMLNDKIRANRKKLTIEKDSKKRQILTLKIQIDQCQLKMTRLKG